ncbi:hypothetical protein F0U44_12045 [Nocardioides humilatus]|uniref:Peptidase C39-like domain-containing protein n=1 Tax=Nocardioides humilatus TaxID=2607660 RepID=A0A5B1LFD2_9ACTN|nr:hypothetical protein [Nocardioides humilatus]KAA1419176.1 hypothetical protein F0U44_12045 [Nocardioides humilatus]
MKRPVNISAAVILGIGTVFQMGMPGNSAAATPSTSASVTVSETDVHLVEDLATSTVSSTAKRRAGLTLAKKAELVAPCATLSFGDVFCLGLGYRDSLPHYGRLLRDWRSGGTGALPFRAWVEQRWAMSNRDRARAQATEVGDAQASLDKAMAVDAFIDSLDTDAPLPTMDSLSAQQTDLDRPAARTDPPEGSFRFIMSGHATKQAESYWCGVATFQMIEWADDDTKQTQAHWADELGTTSSGTAISSIVSLINSQTRWDNAAGYYIVQSVVGWSADRFFNVHQSHLGDGSPAPIVEHPLLSTTYFDYITRDGNGHFQVGRGFSDPADPTLQRPLESSSPGTRLTSTATATKRGDPSSYLQRGCFKRPR